MDRRIEAAIKIIHTEVHRNVPVSELAEGVRLSISHFIRLFKAETSLSPKQYMRCVRMKEAEALLDDSFLSVKEIAASVGIGDRSHFSRDFKRLHGQAPTNFRDRERDDSFLSAKEIAAGAGIRDRSHFSRHFKRLYGHAPTNFRDRKRDPFDE